MNIKVISYLIISIVIIPALSAVAQNSLKKFVPGNIYIHEFFDKFDSLSAQQIIEFRADNGVSQWFARDIRKVVCLDETCRMVQLRLYWDGAANYLRFEIQEEFPLSKTDHTVFNADDYKKLNRILSDASSILGNLIKEDLVQMDVKTQNGIDAVTAATRPAYQELLVSNAAYTCYTLWHTVYGPTQEKIKQLIESSADSQYLKALFEFQEPNYLVWAVNFIHKHSEYHQDFSESILGLILSDNQVVSNHAFFYFTDEKRITSPEVQKNLSENFRKYRRNLQNELITSFSVLNNISNEAYLILLEQYERDLITGSDLRKILTSVQPEKISDIKVQNKLKVLSEGSNPFVRTMTLKLIENE
jgi:hypothetical protein